MKSLVILISMVFGLVVSQYLNDAECGKRPLFTAANEEQDSEGGRIVGGDLAKSGDHKWQVAVLRNGVTFACGGSILNEFTVLTAAHCVVDPASYTVLRTSRRNPLDSWSQSRTVTKVLRHPAFNGATFDNDVALLFLSTPFDFRGSNIGTVCLARVDPIVNQTSVATGWGSTVYLGSTQNDLREVQMLITNEIATTNLYGLQYNPVTMIPAAYPNDGKDTCLGDQGGPLSVSKSGPGGSLDTLEQVGIISWGSGCGRISLYARVTNYYAWINNEINKYVNGKKN